jgi:hypothetical protein
VRADPAVFFDDHRAEDRAPDAEGHVVADRRMALRALRIGPPPVAPSVTPWYIITSSPTTAVSPMTTPTP